MKKIVYGLEARNGLNRGANALANAVKVTLGAKGRNVVIGKNVTKDGVTVAKEVELEDPLENIGAQMVKEVALKTNELAGDGTTTATVLAQAILKEGLKNVAAGANPMDIKRGIDKAVDAIVKNLSKQARSVGYSREKIKQIASVSANNDTEIGELIADAFSKVGKDGVITLEEGKGRETYIDVVEGTRFDKGYLSQYFVTNTDKMEVELENPYILLCEDKINDIKEIAHLMEAVATVNKALLIIADDLSEEVITILSLNKLRGNIKVAAVKAPEFGEKKKAMLEDIAILTGGTVASAERGILLENFSMEMFGSAKFVTIDKDNTTIVDGQGDKQKIKERAKEIKNKISSTTISFEKEEIEIRLAKFTGGVAVLYVGAASEVEMNEKKDRVDDALHATKAAVEEGIVAGGGVALLRAKSCLKNIVPENEDEATGIRIVLRAVEAPLRTIVENAGLEGAVVVAKVLEGKGEFGYNAKTNEYVDMIKAGIIDPKKVTRVALENAASVAGMILTTECVLVELDTPMPPIAPSAGLF